MAGVSTWAGAAVAVGLALLCAVTTSTLAAVSLTLTVESLFCVREVELVGVAVAWAAAEFTFSAPQAASNATTATKKAAQKKRFIEENASSYSVFSFYQKRCSDVPSWFILFVL